MSCEYSLTARRGEYLGLLCGLTMHGCLADQDGYAGHLHCFRRTWANETYATIRGVIATQAEKARLQKPLRDATPDGEVIADLEWVLDHSKQSI